MTSTLPAVAARARRRPSRVVQPPRGSLHDRSRVSRERDGWPEIQLHLPEGALQHGMISAMRELPDHPLTDWSNDKTGYTSAYRSFSPLFTRK